MNSFLRTTARRALGLGVFACSLCLTACGTRSAYVDEGLSLAEERAATLKAGTEFNMARQAFLAGDLDRAMNKVEQSLSISPNVARSHVLRGRILMERGQMGPALEAFDMALAVDAESFDAYYYRGLVFERLERREQALDSFIKAAQIDPTNAQYFIAAAEVLIDEGRLDEAAQLLDVREGEFRTNSGVRHTMGHIAMLQGDHAKAATLFNETRLLLPEEPSVVEDLIAALIASGNLPEAERHLARLLREKGYEDRRDIMHLRGRCLMELDRLAEARQLYLEMTGDLEGASDVDAWLGLARVSLKLNDRQRLNRAIARAIAIAPDRAEPYLLDALARRNQNDLMGALVSIRRANSINPNDPAALTLQGVLELDLNQPQVAARTLSRASSLRPGDASIERLLIAARAANGAFASAPEPN